MYETGVILGGGDVTVVARISFECTEKNSVNNNFKLNVFLFIQSDIF